VKCRNLWQEGFTFTEGPVGSAKGGLFFSDIRANKTYYLDPGGKIAVIREETNGANGLALTKAANCCLQKVAASVFRSAARMAP
jgi:sugar lactone lactonase YvrE